jgi:hypothetical protein
MTGARPPRSAKIHRMADDLTGRWSLRAWHGELADGTAVRHGGDRPRGELIYLPGGRMAVQICHDERERFGSRDLEAGEERGRADAFSTYIAYAGRYSLPEPGVVVHHVEIALHPDQAGMDKRRRYRLEGERLVLETQRVRHEDEPASSLLEWERVQRL